MNKSKTGAVFAFVHNGVDFYRPSINGDLVDGPLYPSWQEAEYAAKRQLFAMPSKEQKENELIKQLAGALQISMRTLDSIYAGAYAKSAWLKSQRRKAMVKALKKAGFDDPDDIS